MSFPAKVHLLPILLLIYLLFLLLYDGQCNYNSHLVFLQQTIDQEISQFFARLFHKVQTNLKIVLVQPKIPQNLLHFVSIVSYIHQKTIQFWQILDLTLLGQILLFQSKLLRFFLLSTFNLTIFKSIMN